MATIKAGLVGEAELEGPMNVGNDNNGSLFDLSSPSTWAFIWFCVALLLLFVL